MAAILFFDDWVIHNSRSLRRNWFCTQPWSGVAADYLFGSRTRRNLNNESEPGSHKELMPHTL